MQRCAENHIHCPADRRISFPILSSEQSIDSHSAPRSNPMLARLIHAAARLGSGLYPILGSVGAGVILLSLATVVAA
jgi:hypothetical protein